MGGPDADSFTIDRTDGQLSTKAALDKEEKDTYTVTVTATDPSGETATITVTIKVTDVDEAPEITVGGLGCERAEQRRLRRERHRLGGHLHGLRSRRGRWLPGRLRATDAGDFRISSAGVLTFSSSPDYENPADADTNNRYMVTVVANDGTNDPAMRDVTITVTEVAEVVPTDLLERYDANDNGGIDRDEVIDAINEYLDADQGAPTRADVITVINLYLDN